MASRSALEDPDQPLIYARDPEHRYEARPPWATKWCEHCRKVTHDDAECWCTRVLLDSERRHFPPMLDAGAACLRTIKTKPTLLARLMAAARNAPKDDPA